MPLWLFFASILLAWPAWTASPDAAASKPAFRADTSLVLVKTAVTDAHNRIVTGLTRGEFQLLENGVRQDIAYFTSEDSPLSTGLVLDSSNSMTDQWAAARQAAAVFLQNANPGDEVFLVSFNDRVRTALGFTRDFPAVRSLAASQIPQGRTSLLDAVYQALQNMKQAANPRRALLLITDGADNASRYTAREVAALARESGAAIYAIATSDPPAEGPGDLVNIAARNLLQELAAVSGARPVPRRSPPNCTTSTCSATTRRRWPETASTIA